MKLSSPRRNNARACTRSGGGARFDGYPDLEPLAAVDQPVGIREKDNGSRTIRRLMGAKPWSPPPRYLFRRHNVIRQIRKLPETRTFLDVGCGAGDLACLLSKELGMSGMGMDFAEEAIATAQRVKEYYGLGE